MTSSGKAHRRTVPGLVIAIALALAFVLSACDAAGPSTAGSPSGSPGTSAASSGPSGPPAASGSAGGAGSSGTGGSAPGGAAPSSSPSTPPGDDVVKAFVARFTGGSFSARSTVTGEMRLGTTTMPISGTFDVSGGDSHQLLTIAVPGAPTTTESLKADGIAYVRKGGLWFEKPADTSGDLSSVLRSMFDVVDIGLESKDGVMLHHLKPRGGSTIPLSAIGASDPNGDGVVSVEFFVEADGTPVDMQIDASWTQGTGSSGEPASMRIGYRFSDVGGRIVITAPGQVWSTFASKRYAYSIAYPVDWEASQSPRKGKPDLFLSAEDTGVYGNRVGNGGYSLNTFTSAYVKFLRRSPTRASVTSNTATTVDGSAARRLEWTVVYKGERQWNIEVLVVRGQHVYSIGYTSLARLTATDRATFDAFISSVVLRGGSATTSAPVQTG